jgi:hypothetical protein
MKLAATIPRKVHSFLVESIAVMPVLVRGSRALRSRTDVARKGVEGTVVEELDAKAKASAYRRTDHLARAGDIPVGRMSEEHREVSCQLRGAKLQSEHTSFGCALRESWSPREQHGTIEVMDREGLAVFDRSAAALAGAGPQPAIMLANAAVTSKTIGRYRWVAGSGLRRRAV